MARRRSRPLHPALIVFGVLHLLGACFGFCILSFHATGLGERFKEAQRAKLQQQNPGVILVFEDELRPELKTIENVELSANAAFSVMLLAAGVGLLLRQGWARWLSVVYAVLSILFKIGDLVIVFAYVAPSWEEHVNADQVMGQLVVAVFSILLGMAYAVAVLVVMFLPSVARSFRRERVPAYLFEDEDEDDVPDDDYDEDNYPRHRRRG
jgi:hypothetical protein